MNRDHKPETSPAPLSRLKELEKREVLAALKRHHWVQSRAAKELGLTLRQMGYRIKQFGLEKLVKEGRAGRSAPKDKVNQFPRRNDSFQNCESAPPRRPPRK